jgi:competence ComEA-like helix-hairpin-helix protein
MSNTSRRHLIHASKRLATGLAVMQLLFTGVSYAQSAAPASTPVKTSAKSKKLPPPAKPMDLNTATSEMLQRLPSVGPVTAQRILDYRKKSGPFQSVDDLLAVRGISNKRLDKIRQYVMVKTPGPAAATPPKTPPKKP